MTSCGFQGCTRSHYAKGLCNAHYGQSKRCHRMWPVRPSTTEGRFWSHVKKADGCWEWQGARHPRGYGTAAAKSKTIRAHRYSWELHFGPVPDGLSVLHRCDNPPCVRPDHLFLGMHTDNMEDKAIKGRVVSAKVTREQVAEMRRLYASGVRQCDLMRRYNISSGGISMIVNRKTWRHVA